MVGLRKIPGVAWRRMDGRVCLIRWETSKGGCCKHPQRNEADGEEGEKGAKHGFSGYT